MLQLICICPEQRRHLLKAGGFACAMRMKLLGRPKIKSVPLFRLFYCAWLPETAVFSRRRWPKDAFLKFRLIELSFPVAPKARLSNAGFKPCHFVVEISRWVLEPEAQPL